MKRVVAIIFGGGVGTRLYPFTKLRAKPAVPLGAKYRLSGIPISNCINSEIHRIYVLTQFNSASLNRHIGRTYALASAGFSPGFVEVLAAQQTPDSPRWFAATADAVRQYLGAFAEWDVDQYSEYWEDIGTIDAFYHANLALTAQPEPPFSFYDEQAPIYTRSRYLPPTKLLDAHVRESMLGEGCILKECTVTRSVIGLRSRIDTGCVIEETLVMGADYYESPSQRAEHAEHGTMPLGVGAHTTIHRAIVDKNARIGRQVRIVNQAHVYEANREALGFVIRNGIVVVIKNAPIPDGMVI